MSNRSNVGPYSITSSARASTVGGTARPSARAVLRLITSSYLVGALEPDQQAQLFKASEAHHTKVCDKFDTISIGNLYLGSNGPLSGKELNHA